MKEIILKRTKEGLIEGKNEGASEGVNKLKV